MHLRRHHRHEWVQVVHGPLHVVVYGIWIFLWSLLSHHFAFTSGKFMFSAVLWQPFKSIHIRSCMYIHTWYMQRWMELISLDDWCLLLLFRKRRYIDKTVLYLYTYARNTWCRAKFFYTPMDRYRPAIGQQRCTYYYTISERASINCVFEIDIALQGESQIIYY